MYNTMVFFNTAPSLIIHIGKCVCVLDISNIICIIKREVTEVF